MLRLPLPLHLPLLLLASIRIAAQDPSFVWHTPRTDYLFTEEVEPAYVLGSDVALRVSPKMDGALVTELSVGTKLSLEERGADTLVHNGIGSAWYRVKAGKVEGWIWGGNIAQRTFGSTADPTVKFVAGIDHIVPCTAVDRIDFSYRIVALREGRELDRIVVRSFSWFFGEVTNHGDRGLKNVDDVITVEVPCVGGCGCSAGDVVIFWSGGKFHHVADLTGSPDGAYSTGTDFIYPADMEGQAGVIIRVNRDYSEPTEVEKAVMRKENEELDEAEGTGVVDDQQQGYITRFVTREYLSWDGNALVTSGRHKEERHYPMAVD